MNEQMDKAQEIQERLTSAIQDALSDAGDEVLLNKWVFIGDILIDGERSIITVWEDSMHPIDVEALMSPAMRLARSVTDQATVGMNAGVLSYLGTVEAEDDEELDD